MKATVIALLLVSACDIVSGVSILRQDTTTGVEVLVFGFLLGQLAFYLSIRDQRRKNIGGRGSAK